MADEAAAAGKAADALYVQLIGDGRSYKNMLGSAVEQTEQASAAIASETKKITEAVKNDVAEDSAILSHMTESRLAKVGQRAVGSGLIIVGMVKRIVGAFQSMEHEAISAFKETETAEMRLSAALETHGGDVEGIMEQYKGFADEMQRVSTMSGTMAKQLLGSAEKFGLTGDKAMRAVKDAQALAARTGGDAGGFIRSISQLESGFVSREFMRLIPALKKAKTEAEKFQLVNKYIADSQRFMNKELNTAAGHWRQLKNEVQDVLEVFGKQIVEALRPLVDMGINAAKWFKSLNPDLQRTLAKITQIVSLVAVGATAWGVWGGAIKDLSTLGLNVIIGLASSLLSWPVLLAAGIGVVIYKSIDLQMTWKDVTSAMQDAWQWLVGYLTPAVEGFVSALKAGDLQMVWKIFSAAFRTAMTDIANLFQANWERVWPWFKENWFTVLSDLGRVLGLVWDESWKRVKIFAVAAKDLLEALAEWLGNRIALAIAVGLGKVDKGEAKKTAYWLGNIFENQVTIALGNAWLKMKKIGPFDPLKNFKWSAKLFPGLTADVSEFANTARDELSNLLDAEKMQREFEQQEKFFEKFGFWEPDAAMREWWDLQSLLVEQSKEKGREAGEEMSKEFAKALRFDAALSDSAESAFRAWEFQMTGGTGGGGGGKGMGRFDAIGADTPEGAFEQFKQDLGDMVTLNEKMEGLLGDIRKNTGRDPVVLQGAGLT